MCVRRACGRGELQLQEVLDVQCAVAQHLAVSLARLHGKGIVVSRYVAMEVLERLRRVNASQHRLCQRQSVDQRVDVAQTPAIQFDGKRQHTCDYKEGGCRQVKDVEVSANLGWANPATASSMVMRKGW